MWGWIAIYGAVVAAATLYAWILNKPRVYNWYTPDRTWVTVVVGNGIILAGLALICLFYALPWIVWWIVFFLNVAAGVPIITWQNLRNAKRRHRAARVLWRD